ncbi:MAG: 6-bladed beta-propeller [Tannerella sp.]|jgi:hypothetical protein|nr:6-bladed beta-propeller [Tannerella sp.]
MKKIVLFCVVLFISCQNEKSTFSGLIVNKHDVEKIEIMPLENENALLDYKIVKLETNSNSLLAEINQMEIVDNYIYVFDKKGKSVKKFTVDGKYVTDIGKRGDGPKEYLEINAFYVNKERRNVNMFDPMRKAILRYDLEGNFMNIIKTNNDNLNFIIKAAAIGNNEVFCHSASNWCENYAFFILNENDYSIKKIIRYHPGKSGKWTSFSLATNTFSICGDKVDFVSLFSDFIYVYKKESVSEFMLITDHKSSLSNEMIDKKMKEYNNDMLKLMIDVCKSDNYTIGLSEIYETNKYILCNYFAYDLTLTTRSVLWDKERKLCYRLSNDFSAPNFCNPLHSFDDTFVRVWNGNEIDNFKDAVKNGIYQASQIPQNIMNSIKDYNEENDNPILIFYTAKKP